MKYLTKFLDKIEDPTMGMCGWHIIFHSYVSVDLTVLKNFFVHNQTSDPLINTEDDEKLTLNTDISLRKNGVGKHQMNIIELLFRVSYILIFCDYVVKFKNYTL
jgi:5-methylcytosine-specific restriction endonuclease McrBC regulatory subunit McrC